MYVLVVNLIEDFRPVIKSMKEKRKWKTAKDEPFTKLSDSLTYSV